MFSVSLFGRWSKKRPSVTSKPAVFYVLRPPRSCCSSPFWLSPRLGAFLQSYGHAWFSGFVPVSPCRSVLDRSASGLCVRCRCCRAGSGAVALAEQAAGRGGLVLHSQRSPRTSFLSASNRFPVPAFDGSRAIKRPTSSRFPLSAPVSALPAAALPLFLPVSALLFPFFLFLLPGSVVGA